MTSKISQLESDLAQRTQDVADIKVKMLQQKEEMTNLQNDNEDEFNTKLKKERKKYQEEIESNNKRYQEDKDQTNKKYQEEIESLQEDNTKAINKLNRQMQFDNDKFLQEK